MINDIIQWILKKLNAFIEFVIFWQHWDNVSLFIFIGLLLLIMIFVYLLKRHQQEMPKKPQNMRW